MAKGKTKQFIIADAHQLGLVDRWWAGLLHLGMKELLRVEWEALGEMEWRLRVHWQPLPGRERLNVGHPRLSDVSTEQLEEALQDALAEFESAYSDFNHLERKAEEWGMGEEEGPDKTTRVVFSDDLDEAEKIIALEFLWPMQGELRRLLHYLTTQMTELDQEIKARNAPDYYIVRVDRGMLRAAFLEQVGYDNEWLFEDVPGRGPRVEE